MPGCQTILISRYKGPKLSVTTNHPPVQSWLTATRLGQRSQPTQQVSKKPTKTICRTNRLLAPPPLSSFGLWADFGFRSFETPIKGVLNTLFLGLTLFFRTILISLHNGQNPSVKLFHSFSSKSE